MYLLDVYVPNANLKVDRTFTYYSEVKPLLYARVKINFHGAFTYGLVYKITEIHGDIKEIAAQRGYEILKILEIVDDKPYINDKQIELAKWLAKTTISPFVSCLNLLLPKSLKVSKKIVHEKTQALVYKQAGQGVLTPKQKAIWDKINDGELLSEVRKYSPSIVNKLIKMAYLDVQNKPLTYKNKASDSQEFFKTLNDEQAMAYNGIIDTNKTISLLFGVTGSGKTEVYLHLARYYLYLGKQVLILVPEIALTPQMIKRVKDRFADVIFYHSALTHNEREIQYRRLQNKEASIVVGTRSAVFLPFDNLGLIILDEEHDSSYKQENIPLYHTKNVAYKLAMMFAAKVLLASATPSLESYTHALRGDYAFFKLTKRINCTLPLVEIVDLNKEIRSHGSYIIAHDLKKAIEDVLSLNHQVIILLNRRGYAPIVKCGHCGATLMCDDCDIPLSYHQDEGLLKCHRCGRTYPIAKTCPTCGHSELSFYGFGTKKVEMELKRLFPMAKVARMDHDSTRLKGAHEAILKAFAKHDIDILIGTQMIAKGLDFPLVELVGILNADAGLMHQDYNAAKMTFDLLMQASGRSGRANIAGKVIIQAFNPDHYVLKAVVMQDYNYFYNIEMNYRRLAKYPPYSHIVAIYISDKNTNNLTKSLDILDDLLSDAPFRLFKAINIGKLGGICRYRAMLMDKDLIAMLNYLHPLVADYIKKATANIKIDIDPLYLE